jgi:hypothetical protein
MMKFSGKISWVMILTIVISAISPLPVAHAGSGIVAAWRGVSWTAIEIPINNDGSAILSTNTSNQFNTSTDAPPGASGLYVSNGWDGGANSKYWKVVFKTTGMQNLKVSSQQKSTDLTFLGWDGPRDFKLQYSLDNSIWTDVSGGTLTLTGGWTAGGRLTNLSLPSAMNNQPNVYLRWIMTSNDSVGTHGFNADAQSMIAEIIITGDEIPAAPTDITLSNNSTFAP